MPRRKVTRENMQPPDEDHVNAGMKDIAQRVGVSKTTVHRALTGRGRISSETRERILAVAGELDYTPNTLARSLRRQKTGIIGVIISGVSNSYYASLLSAIEEAASGQGFTLLFCCSTGPRELEITHLNVLREKRVDGLLVAPAHPRRNVEEYERLKRVGLPFVFIDRFMPAISADAVMTDHRLGGQLVAEHMIAGGRRKIGIIMPLDFENLATSIQDRVNGVSDIADQNGVQVVRIGQETLWEPLEDYAAHSLSMFLDSGGEVDAIFGINDHYALGALYACRVRGLDVPGDIAVVGYDDLDVSSYVIPRLTTIRQPVRQLAWESVKVLLSRMGGARPAEAITIRLRPKLMERESTPAVESSTALTPAVSD